MGLTLTRRTFLKATAVAGGMAVASRFLYGGLETLAVQGTRPSSEPEEEWVPTTCWIGKQDCGMVARRINGRVVKLEGHPAHPLNRGTLCPKGQAQITALYDPHRVTTPLIRTNPKGEPGQFRPASWEEALDLVAQKIKEARAKNPKRVVWQKGRSKSGALYDTAFANALGAEKLHHGAFCSDAGYRACEYTIGLNGVLHPDFRYCRYLLAWGWNITSAGGNKLCFITFPQQFLRAREQGMKVILIDPRLRPAGPHVDEWLPIRPGTDLVFILGLCNLLIQQGTVDRDYLTRYTNAPFLVQEDGYFFRVEGKEQVWDARTGRPQPYDREGVEPVLEGVFTWEGHTLKTAFQAFKEEVVQYPPERVEQTCGISADQVRRIAREMGEEARIGATLTIKGKPIPYRPVAIHTYHFSQQELGFQTVRGMLLLMMLLGSIGAVGGQRSDFTWKVHGNFKALDEVEIKDPPYNIWLKNSKFFPINSNNSAVVALVLRDPQRWGVQELPEVMIIHMSNSLLAFGSTPDILEGFKRIPFIVVLDPWLSRTADYLADVVLPVATLEKWEGPFSPNDGYEEALALRIPVMEPMGESRGEIDIYLDLAERVGVLYGEGGYLDQINKALGLKDPYQLPLDRKPTVREIFDRWAKSQGIQEGVRYFERNGVFLKGPIPVEKQYGYAQDPPFGGIRHRFYGESLLRYRDQMRAKGVEEIFWRDYTPLPRWRPPTMESSPSRYDLYLVSFKEIENKQSRSSHFPLLAELVPEQRLHIHPETARARGLKDGDWAWVESHNAVTGETRRVKVRVMYTEGIRPDVVGLPHHFGEVARHPWAKGQGPSSSSLFFTGPGYLSNTADQSFHVKVRVYKA